MSGPAADTAAGRSAWPVLANPALLILFFAMLVSTAGAHLLLVGIAVHYHKATGSTAVASLVYVVQMLAPVALIRLAARHCATMAPRRLLITCEIAGLGSALLLAASPSLLWLTLALFAVRGYLDILVKSARAVALKAQIERADIELANTVSTSSFLLGAFAGSLVGSLLIERLSVTELACITAGTSAVAALFYTKLGPSPAPAKPATSPQVLPVAMSAFRSDPVLGRAFVYLVASTALFQGIHQSARVHVPIRDLGLGGGGVSMLQACAFAGVLAGLLIAGATLTARSWAPRLLPGLTLATAIAGLGAPISGNPAAAFTAYFAFMLLYELTFVVSMNAVVARCAASSLPVMMVLFYACAFGGMALTAMLTGLAMDQLGSSPVFVAIAVVAAVFVLAIEWPRSSLRHKPDAKEST